MLQKTKTLLFLRPCTFIICNQTFLVGVLFNFLTFFSAPGMILTLPPEEEEVEQQQLLATKDTNGKVTHVIVKDQEKQPV